MGSSAARYLEEMGIDVWVLRRRARPVARDAVPEPEVAAHGQSAPDAQERRTVAPPGPTPNFHLCFMTYADLSLVISVPRDATTLPAPMRRFADDLASSLSREPNPVVTALRWPMVKSEHIDQSPAAAKAVIEQRLAACGPSILLFGRDAEQLVGETAADRRYLVLDDVSVYLEEPLGKRELWKALKVLRGGRTVE